MNRRELLALFGLGAATVIVPAPYLDALTRKADLAAVRDLPLAELRGAYVLGCGDWPSVGGVIVRSERGILLHWHVNTCSAFQWLPRPEEERVRARAFTVEADEDIIATAYLRRGTQDYVITNVRDRESPLYV